MLDQLISGRLAVGLFLFSKGDKIVEFTAEQSKEITAFAFERYRIGRDFIEDLIKEFEESSFAMSDGVAEGPIFDTAYENALLYSEFETRDADAGSNIGREVVRLAMTDPKALRDIMDSYAEDFQEFQTVGIPDDYEVVGQASTDQKAYHVPTGEERVRYDELTGAGEGEVFAVLDTGVRRDHPDLAGKILGVFSEVPNESGDDINGHGTHVFGTCCGSPDIALAHKAKGVSIKVLGGPQGSGLSTWIESGLRRARLWRGPKGERVTVINMSIGGGGFHAGTQREIELCEAAGIIVIAAAGNDGWRRGTDKVNWPARGEGCFATGAIDENENVASFTSGGPLVDGAAPGVRVVSASHRGGRVELNGTSMASPNKASEAASTQSFLVRNGFARLDGTDEFLAFHTKHARDIFDQGPDDATGEGVLDVYETLADEKPEDVTMLASGLKSAIQLAGELLLFCVLFASPAVAQDPVEIDTVVKTIKETTTIFGTQVLSTTTEVVSETKTTEKAIAVPVKSDRAVLIGSDLQPFDAKATEDGVLLLTKPGEYLVFDFPIADFQRVTVEAPAPEFDLSTIEPLVKQLAATLNDPPTQTDLAGVYFGSTYNLTAPDVSLEAAKAAVKQSVLEAFRRRGFNSQRVDWVNGFQRPLQKEFVRLEIGSVEAYRLALLEVAKGLGLETEPAPSTNFDLLR